MNKRSDQLLIGDVINVACRATGFNMARSTVTEIHEVDGQTQISFVTVAAGKRGVYTGPSSERWNTL